VCQHTLNHAPCIVEGGSSRIIQVVFRIVHRAYKFSYSCSRLQECTWIFIQVEECLFQHYIQVNLSVDIQQKAGNMKQTYNPNQRRQYWSYANYCTIWNQNKQCSTMASESNYKMINSDGDHNSWIIWLNFFTRLHDSSVQFMQFVLWVEDGQGQGERVFMHIYSIIFLFWCYLNILLDATCVMAK
jgi:hypothetical protein